MGNSQKIEPISDTNDENAIIVPIKGQIDMSEVCRLVCGIRKGFFKWCCDEEKVQVDRDALTKDNDTATHMATRVSPPSNWNAFCDAIDADLTLLINVRKYFKIRLALMGVVLLVSQGVLVAPGLVGFGILSWLMKTKVSTAMEKVEKTCTDMSGDGVRYCLLGGEQPYFGQYSIKVVTTMGAAGSIKDTENPELKVACLDVSHSINSGNPVIPVAEPVSSYPFSPLDDRQQPSLSNSNTISLNTGGHEGSTSIFDQLHKSSS